MLPITSNLAIPLAEIDISAVRSQGAGGQNVNKVASAVHLRFDIQASSLPPHLKERLLGMSDQRITKDGVVIIKAQRQRTQEQNRADALERLRALIRGATVTARRRTPTRPTRSARRKRTDAKTRRGRIKNLRQKVNLNDH